MKEAELKPCPFCGGKAEVHYQPIYTSDGVCISCTECKARSKFFPCNCTYQFYHGEKNIYISKERATSDAINLWNRRAETMSGEKQIEEVARILNPDSCFEGDITACRKMEGCDICKATKLYNAGYRKQSEVIDEFEERLKKVLYDTPSIFTQQRYIVVHEIDKLVEEMKGGAE